MNASHDIPIVATITAAELSQKAIPPLRWIVPGLLPEGVTILAGAPKSGKSFLALQLATAAASGADFAGLGQPGQIEVLYLALEDSERRLKERQAPLHDGPQPAGLHYALEWRPLDQGGMGDLEEWLDEHPDVRLVIVDVFTLVRRAARPGKNIYEEDYAAIRDLKALASGRDVSIILIHHTNKSDAATALNSISGSTGLTGAADTIMVLNRDEGSHDASLSITGRDVDSGKLRLRFQDGRWSDAGAEGKSLAPTRQKIVDVLEQAQQPLSPKEIAARTGLQPQLAKKTLRRMADDDQVRRTGHGAYSGTKRVEAKGGVDLQVAA